MTTSEEPPPPSDGKTAEDDALAPAPMEEKTLEPGEEWIEEYESEKKETPPAERRRHLLGAVVAVAIIIALVLWTLLSPQVLPVAGGTYIGSSTYANLGSDDIGFDLWWLFDVVHIAETSWGVSISGEQNVSAGQSVMFQVLVTKVSETMKNPWFVGTSIDLKKAEMYTESGTRLGTMVSKSDEPFGPLAIVEVVFDSPGEYQCEVFVELTIYGKMVVGFLPVKVLRISVDLDVAITAS